PAIALADVEGEVLSFDEAARRETRKQRRAALVAFADSAGREQADPADLARRLCAGFSQGKEREAYGKSQKFAATHVRLQKPGHSIMANDDDDGRAISCPAV